MKEFRQDNTEGYTESQLEKLNDEWKNRVKKLHLEPGTDEYYQQEKAFSDDVARR